MNGNDVALTGVPRGGTTLACRLAGAAPRCVALFEPLDPSTLPAPADAAIDAILAFFAESRQRLEREGVAPSKQRDGGIPDNPFAPPDAAGHRRWMVSRGLLQVEPPAPGFTLAIKHNALFTALLPALARRMRVVAVVRNPLAVLASWNTVDLPVREGRVPAGERFDSALAARLDAEPDRVGRQLRVLDWFFSRFRAAGATIEVVRYEAIVASRGQALYAAAGIHGSDDGALHERNASAAYRGVGIDALAARLAATDGAWRHWYPETETEALRQRLLAPAS